MEKYFEVLESVKLFQDIDREDLSAMLSCLGAKVVHIAKDEYIIMAGDKFDQIGILLEGSAHIVKEDMDGNRTLVSALSAGDFFAEVICCAGLEESPVSVVTDTASAVMLLDYGRIIRVCPNSCIFHTNLIQNLLAAIVEKNIILQNRMDILSKKTVRLKVIALLESFHANHGGHITLPFNREQLADFLCVDRSALSHELSRMKKEGLIDYHKNSFKLLHR